MKVIFRKDKKTNEVIAFFPETYKNGMVDCYTHIGQHSQASIEYYWGNTKRINSSEEYLPLWEELNRIGYKNIKLRFRMSY